MNRSFEEIQAGLSDAINHAKGLNSQIIEHKPEVLEHFSMS
jgi:hypothetical protein